MVYSNTAGYGANVYYGKSGHLSNSLDFYLFEALNGAFEMQCFQGLHFYRSYTLIASTAMQLRFFKEETLLMA